MFYMVVWQHMQRVMGLDNHFVTNLRENQPVKEFWKSVKIWQWYHHKYGVSLVMEHDVVHAVLHKKIGVTGKVKIL